MKQKIINSFLPYVSKPGKYLGNEINSIHKNTENILLGTVVSPNIYENVMSAYGFRRFYVLLNKSFKAFWQRAFLPDPDNALEVLIKKEIPLFTLEENTPVKNSNIILIYIQDVLEYLSFSQLFRAIQIPLHRQERTPNDPMVLAIGPGILNPEPIAPFVDGFAIGEFEAFLPVFENFFKLPFIKEEVIDLLNMESGFYFPGLYWNGNEKNDRISRQFVKELSSRYFPSKLPIPYIDLRKNYYRIEMMRGTVENNRAFSSDYVNRPIRMRRLENIALEIKNAIRYEGEKVFEVFALHPEENSEILNVSKKIKTISNESDIRFFLDGIHFNNDPWIDSLLKSLTKNRFRFRLITVDSKLRSLLNISSPVNENENMFLKLISLGWEHFSFDVLFGIPGETNESLEAVAEWLNNLAGIVKDKPQLTIKINIKCFIPEPFTPLQWESAIDNTSFLQKVELFKAQLKIYNCSFNVENPMKYGLKTVLYRSGQIFADELALDLVGMEEWYDHIFDSEQGIGRKRLETLSLYDDLPWDHIDFGISRHFLQNERMKAIDHKLTFTCQLYKCYNCGLQRPPFKENVNCYVESENKPQPGKYEHVLRNFNLSSEKTISYGRGLKRNESSGQQLVRRLRIKYIKKGTACFLTHQDVGRLFDRASGIAGFPIAYSQGKIPKPKLSFGLPLTLGYESEGEYMDVEVLVLKEADMLEKVNKFMPPGIVITEAKVIYKKVPSLVNSVNEIEYKIYYIDASSSKGSFFDELSSLWSEEKILIKKEQNDEELEIDIKLYWKDLKMSKDHSLLTFHVLEGKSIRLTDIIDLCSSWQNEKDLFAISRSGQFRVDSALTRHLMMDLL